MTGSFDAVGVERAVRDLLVAIGEDPDRDGLRRTPERVARAYAEQFAGLHIDPSDVLQTTFDEGHEEMVLVKDIEMYSTCEHHLVPFHGVAHVGYIPNVDGRITGRPSFFPLRMFSASFSEISLSAKSRASVSSIFGE